MLTILDYALLSQHIYHPERSLTRLKPRDSKLGKGYEGWVRFTDVDPKMHSSSNFFAQLYVKFQDGLAREAVVAIRGTVVGRLDNDVEDIVSWWSDVLAEGGADRLPGYLSPAIKFYYEAKAYVRHYFPNITQVSVTGHSLGGAVAQLITLTGHPAKAVVFNSPGCGNMPGINPNYTGLVYSINAKYGFINKVGVTVKPLIFLVDVPEDAAQAKAILQDMDKEAYEQSEQDFKAGHNVGGTYERLKALLHTEDVVAKLAETTQCFSQAAQEQMNNPDLVWSWQVRTVVAFRNSCEGSKGILQTYEDVIMAQHSISNMVGALTDPANVGVGYQAI